MRRRARWVEVPVETTLMRSRALAFADALAERGFRGRVRVEERRWPTEEQPYVDGDFVVYAAIVSHPGTRRTLADAVRSARWELLR